MRLGEGFSCIYIPQNTPDHRTVECFWLQIWFTSTQTVLFVHDLFPSKSVMVHCVQSILIVFGFFSKTHQEVFLTSEVQMFFTLSIKNKKNLLYILQKAMFQNIFDHLLQLQDEHPFHFVALSHCPVCYCVMNRPPLPPLGEENMFSSSLWQEGIVKVK